MSVIVKPIVTEKMTQLGESLNRFAFVVDKDADKLAVKKAVEALYDVTVVTVNTMNYSGKSKVRFTKSGVQAGRTKAIKKAIVTLKEGDTIDFYSNI